MESLAIIGNGNLARFFQYAFAERVPELAVYARSPKNDTDRPLAEYRGEADLILLCVQDDALGPLSRELPQSKGLLLHHSGTADWDVLDPKHEKRGVLWPIMSIGGGTYPDLTTIPFCAAASDHNSEALLREFCRLQQIKASWLSGEEKFSLHLAAVWAQNFSNHLQQIAFDLLAQKGLSFALIQPLLLQSIMRLKDAPPRKWQTGPAIRRDESTMARHLEALERPEDRELYLSLSRHLQAYHEEKL